MSPDTDPEHPGSLLEAIHTDALRSALVPRRPVFGNPWDSTADMFACALAVSFIDPLLLWGGGALMSSIFNFNSRWHLGVYIAAAVVGAAGFMTIVGRERTSVSVDVLAIAAWLVLGVIVAPVLGLALPIGVALACYAVILVGVLGFVLRFGRFEVAFFHTLSWPITWSVLAAFFAYSAYHLILYA